jgi:hypothetical protein
MTNPTLLAQNPNNLTEDKEMLLQPCAYCYMYVKKHVIVCSMNKNTCSLIESHCYYDADTEDIGHLFQHTLIFSVISCSIMAVLLRQ